MRIGISCLVVALSACAANPGIVEMSPGTYMLSREDKGGIFGNASAMKSGVIKEANAFAASKGKVAIPISTHETPYGQDTSQPLITSFGWCPLTTQQRSPPQCFSGPTL